MVNTTEAIVQPAYFESVTSPCGESADCDSNQTLSIEDDLSTPSTGTV